MIRTSILALLILLTAFFMLAAGRLELTASEPSSAAITSPRTSTFFEVRGEPALLAQRLAELPVRIRLSGLGWALVEVSDADLAAVEPRLPSPTLLRRIEASVKLVQVRESELEAAARGEYEPYTLLKSPEEDLRVLALPAETAGEEHIGGAHAHLLPEAMSPRALAPLPAAERSPRPPGHVGLSHRGRRDCQTPRKNRATLLPAHPGAPAW